MTGKRGPKSGAPNAGRPREKEKRVAAEIRKGRQTTLQMQAHFLLSQSRLIVEMLQ